MFRRYMNGKTDKEIAGTLHFMDYKSRLHCTRQFEEMSFVYKISDEVYEVTPQDVGKSYDHQLI